MKIWVGRVLSGLVILFFAFDSITIAFGKTFRFTKQRFRPVQSQRAAVAARDNQLGIRAAVALQIDHDPAACLRWQRQGLRSVQQRGPRRLLRRKVIGIANGYRIQVASRWRGDAAHAAR